MCVARDELCHVPAVSALALHMAIVHMAKRAVIILAGDDAFFSYLPPRHTVKALLCAQHMAQGKAGFANTLFCRPGFVVGNRRQNVLSCVLGAHNKRPVSHSAWNQTHPYTNQ